MTKSALIDALSAKIKDLSRSQVEAIVNTIFDGMKNALGNGEKIEIRGFGNFRLRQRNPKIARNPKTGEKVQVPAKKVVHFKISRTFHNLLNK
jgi:integration host factor subunit beta